MEPFIFWTANYARKPGACQYYRIHVPMNYFREHGIANCYEAVGEDVDSDIQVMFSADVSHFYSVMGPTILDSILAIKGMNAVTRENGEIKYPPITIYDADDNTDYVHPSNMSYVSSGTRTYPDGKLIVPGSILYIEDENGNRINTWVDKETHYNGVIFDIERNLKHMKVRHKIVKNCDGATVTTPKLASYFKEVLKQPNVHVFPNTIVTSDYGMYDVVRENPSEIRVLWQGSQSHYIDWYPLRNALRTVANKHKNIKWIIWGEYFDWIHDVIPEDRIEWLRWTQNEGYRIKRGLLNIDINICPLADDVFNWCKSAIKWYEGSIWKRPEVTLASNVGPYKEEMVDGETGFLFNNEEEFIKKFDILIENEELRKTMAYNSNKWVFTNRIPEVTIPPLLEFYNDLKLQQKAKLTPKIIVAPR